MIINIPIDAATYNRDRYAEHFASDSLPPPAVVDMERFRAWRTYREDGAALAFLLANAIVRRQP